MIQSTFTTLKKRLTKLAWTVSWPIPPRTKPAEPDASLALLHEKVDALAEAAGYEFWKPRMKDYLGNDVLDKFKARKKAKR